MTKSLALIDKTDADDHGRLKNKNQANIFLFNGKSGLAKAEALQLSKPSGLLKNCKNDPDGSEIKSYDYLLIVLLALAFHVLVVENLKHMSLEKEVLPEPVKTESKVQISFVRPKPAEPPKPVAQKPLPPPKPKVVPLKKPPKTKITPKPAPAYVAPEPVSNEAPVAAPVEAAPVAPPPPKPVEKITQPSAGAAYLHNPPPNYPEEAMERGWEGKVLLKVHVLASGKPDTVNIAKSSGHAVLDREAVRTIGVWSFVPGKRGSTPIEGWVTVPIKFNLQS
jgi:protein TonB